MFDAYQNYLTTDEKRFTTGKSKDVSDTEKITVFQHFSPSSLSQA